MQSNALSFLQEIFAVDEGNYMGHVFAGLAGLELGRYTEAKQHYKTAIAAQPDEPLAWKVVLKPTCILDVIICSVVLQSYFM